MSILDIYRACLVELNKVQAPSLLLEDFNYLYNKAVQQQINKKYNQFEINQQSTDDLRVLTKTVKIIPTATTSEDAFGTSYDCPLPSDYMHILNCICEFKDNKPRCNDCPTIRVGANKLTTNQWSQVITNYYMKPSVKRPYFYIINLEDPVIDVSYPRNEVKQDGVRYGNSTYPIMQIKCGNNPRYELKAVYVDYLRTPKYTILTEDQINDSKDTSTIVEFNDYVIYEIINNVVALAMENGVNPRVQNFTGINTTIDPPIPPKER